MSSLTNYIIKYWNLNYESGLFVLVICLILFYIFFLSGKEHE